MVKNELFFNADFQYEILEFRHKIELEEKSEEIGYYHLPKKSREIIKEATDFFSNKKYKNIVLIGIGGSSVGVRAIYNMLENRANDVKIYFLDNVDNFTFSKTMKEIDFLDTLFIVSSKSGTTIETISLFKSVISYFNVSDFSKNFIIITDPSSPLENYAKQKNIKFFNLDKNVGGRFSVLSAIGIIPLLLCGFDVNSILDGAQECKDEFFINKNDLILQKAYYYAKNEEEKINVLFSYCDRLKYFNDWYVQLWAESLGKKKDGKKVGLTPVGLVGSRDQHSFLQLIIEGEKNKTTTFIKIQDNDFNDEVPNISLLNLEKCDFVNGLKMSQLVNFQCDATLKALLGEGIACDLITIDRLNEYNVGYLIFYYELLTSMVGSILDINTYDQPGVEIGKMILKNMVEKTK